MSTTTVSSDRRRLAVGPSKPRVTFRYISNGLAKLSMPPGSGRLSVAFKRCALRIDLERVHRGRAASGSVMIGGERVG